MPGCLIIEVWWVGWYWCTEPPPRLVEAARNSADAVQLAAEVGRLDVITFILGLLTVLLAFFALGWFAFMSRHVSAVAERVAKSEAKEHVERFVVQEARPIVLRTAMAWMEENKDSMFDTSDDKPEDIEDLMQSLEEADGGS